MSESGEGEGVATCLDDAERHRKADVAGEEEAELALIDAARHIVVAAVMSCGQEQCLLARHEASKINFTRPRDRGKS